MTRQSQDDHDSTDGGTDDDTDPLTLGRRTALGLLGTAAATGLDGDLLGGFARRAVADETGDHSAVMGLVPTGEATHTATSSGGWSQSGTWNDGMPGDGAKVHIPEGTTVTVNGEFGARLHWVRVDGTLRFATDTDTHLRVDTIVTTEGSRFEIGSENDPISDDVTARITFIDRGELDESWDPERISRGLLTMGAVRTKGKHVLPFTELAAFPKAGDSSIQLSESPDGWENGDQVVVPGVKYDRDGTYNEERTITGISGQTVSLDAPLAYDHVPPKDDLPVHVAHLDRNIRLESENSATKRRGHVMFMNQDVRFRDVGLYELGRTDKSRHITDPVVDISEENETLDQMEGGPDPDPDPNVKARYSCHFHRTARETPFDEAPGRVRNCVARGSPGWGFVNHQSNAHFAENVSYEVLGAHYVCEMGVEFGSFTRNIAIQARGSDDPDSGLAFRTNIGDHGHRGDGFWMQGPGVGLEDNVVASVRAVGFWYFGYGVAQEEHKPVPLARYAPIGYPEREAKLTTPTVHQRRSGRSGDDGRIGPANVGVPTFQNNTTYALGRPLRTYARQDAALAMSLPYSELSAFRGLTGYNFTERMRFNHSGHMLIEDGYFVGGEHSPDGFDVSPTRFIVEDSHFEGLDTAVKGQWGLRSPFVISDCTFVDNDVDIFTEENTAAVVRVVDSNPTTIVGPGTDDDGVEIVDPSDHEELGSVENVVVPSPAEDARIAYHLADTATLYGKYEVRDDDQEAWNGEYVGTDEPVGRGANIWYPPEDERLELDFDVPVGNYDIWLRGKQKDRDQRDGLSVNWWLDPPEEDHTDLPGEDGDWDRNMERHLGSFGWIQLDSDVALDGEHQLLLGNSHNLDALDAVMLIKDETEPIWPPAREASHVGDPGDTERTLPDPYSIAADVAQTVAEDGYESDRALAYDTDEHPSESGSFAVSTTAAFGADQHEHFRAVYRESETTQGQAVRYVDDAGRELLTVGSANPEVTVHSGDGYTILDQSPSPTSGTWRAFEVDIDWEETTIEVTWEDLEGGSGAETTTVPFVNENATNVARVEYGADTRSEGPTMGGASVVGAWDHVTATPVQEDEQEAEYEDHTGEEEVTVTVAPDGNHQFDPAKIKIDQGTTVTWEWDAAGHTLTPTGQPSAAAWAGNPDIEDAGTTHAHAFETLGEYAYQCDLHAEQMTGAIRVVEADDEDCQSVTEALSSEDGTVGDADLLRAIRYWQDDTEVPDTCGETVSDADLLELIELWRQS